MPGSIAWSSRWVSIVGDAVDDGGGDFPDACRHEKRRPFPAGERYEANVS
jgi:hypothetical protein